MNIQLELQKHHHKISNIISDILKQDIELFEYCNYTNETISNYYEWSFIQQLLFKNICGDKAHTKILAASELVLLAAYLKDDILDESNIRQNKQTLKKKYGCGIAGLVSDYLFTKGLEIIYQEIYELKGKKIATEVQNGIIKGYNSCVKGQILGKYTNFEENSLNHVLNVIQLKTISILEPLFLIPTIMYNPKMFLLYRDFTKNLGYSLQILNDITDIIGKEFMNGKPVLEDLISHQTNIVFAYFLKHSQQDITDTLIKYIQYPDIKTNDITQEKIISLFIESKAVEDSYNLFLEFNENLLMAIEKFENSFVKIKLIEIVEYFLNNEQ